MTDLMTDPMTDQITNTMTDIMTDLLPMTDSMTDILPMTDSMIDPHDSLHGWPKLWCQGSFALCNVEDFWTNFAFSFMFAML